MSSSVFQLIMLSNQHFVASKKLSFTSAFYFIEKCSFIAPSNKSAENNLFFLSDVVERWTAYTHRYMDLNFMECFGKIWTNRIHLEHNNEKILMKLCRVLQWKIQISSHKNELSKQIRKNNVEQWFHFIVNCRSNELTENFSIYLRHEYFWGNYKRNQTTDPNCIQACSIPTV